MIEALPLFCSYLRLIRRHVNARAPDQVRNATSNMMCAYLLALPRDGIEERGGMIRIRPFTTSSSRRDG
jgi:hypothetical protein